jgi:hypothetical protein
MKKKILKVFTIFTLILGTLLFISIRDVFAELPLVSGVENDKYYNHPVEITFDDLGGTVTATLNDGTTTISILSPYEVTVDGEYILELTDNVETTTIRFWIDTIYPVITILPYTTTPTNKDIIGKRNGGRRDAGRQQPHLYGERQFHLHRQRCGRQYESSHGGHH